MIRAEKKRIADEIKREKEEQREKERAARKEARTKINKDENNLAALQAYLDGEGTQQEVADRFGINVWIVRQLVKIGGHRKKVYSKRNKKNIRRVRLNISLDPDIEQLIRDTGIPTSEYINNTLRKHFARNKNKNKHEKENQTEGTPSM